MGESAKVAEFILTESRYIQQVGEPEPRLVLAAPDHPVKVRLPAMVKRQQRKPGNKAPGDKLHGEFDEFEQPEDPFLRRVESGPGPMPVDVRPGKHGVSRSAPPAREAVKKIEPKAPQEG